MNLIFLGPPGAGKGTHAARLALDMGMAGISTGDLFRAAIRDRTPLGVEAQRYTDKGELVPDQIVIGMVREHLPTVKAPGGYILDGFPRTLEQAEALTSFAHIDAVISLELPDEVVVERLTSRRMCTGCGKIHNLASLSDPAVCPDCGGRLTQREDDKRETILHRLDVYHRQTEPLIGYYSRLGLLRRVDSDASVDETYARLRRALGLSAT